jgi:hypothetical protein
MKLAEQVSTRTSEKKPGKNGKWQKSKKIYLLTLIFLMLCAIGSGFAAVGYHTYNVDYHQYQSQAQLGMQHLRKAETLLETLSKNPFDTDTIQHAQQEFAAAHTMFAELGNNLESIPGISTLIPVYGARLSTAIHLVSAATEFSQAGAVGCSMLNVFIPAFHDPLNAKVHGLTMANFNAINTDFQQVRVSLDQAMGDVSQVQPGDLQFMPQIGSSFATLQKELPTLKTWLNAIGNLLPVLPTMLGISTPANYLIEVLDSTELRPGGGFIGNYGIATFAGGRLTSAHITDVDLLDRPYEMAGHHISYPLPYTWFAHDLVPSSWSFRDSNLDADFPTAARYGEETYKEEGGNVPVQGVIAITPALIQQALAITGPIYVPEYKEIVTPQNLISLIHFHQLGGSAAGEGSDLIPSPDGHSSLRKRFTELLAEHFFARLQQLSSNAQPKFLQLVASSLRSKDVQVYFNATGAENILQLLDVNATIQSPPGDHLFIVDANISPNKANSFIVTTVNDQVSIDTQGNAHHRTTISYAWILPGQNYGSPTYKDYSRVYAPLGSTLTQQDGWLPQGTSTGFGSEIWAGYFTLVYGHTRTITLQWISHNVAKKEANGWYYQYLLQKQAGTQRTLKVQVQLPACGVITNKSPGLATGISHTVSLVEAWNEDKSISLDYRCG